MKLSDGKKSKLLFLAIVLGTALAMFGAYQLVQETPSKELCDDMMDLMADPVHNKLHQDYVETMQLIHIFIEKCGNAGMYGNEDPNEMIGMKEQMNLP